MLLIDMSNLVFSSAIDYHTKTGEQISLDTLRHMTLNSLKSVKDKLKDYCQDGYCILCFDAANYWRRDFFPHYKGKRKSNRDKTSLDWNKLFEAYKELKVELKENIPCHFLLVDGAEADDLIAVLAERYAKTHKICIASSDTDFVQLQITVDEKIKQWSLYHKKFITPKIEKYDLFEHVLRGDTGDGIPNILSDDDVFMCENKRQKSLMTKKIDDWRTHGLFQPEKFCDDLMLERFKRNLKLIDFREIPENISQKIVDEFETVQPAKGKVFGYLVAHRLTSLIGSGKF